MHELERFLYRYSDLEKQKAEIENQLKEAKEYCDSQRECFLMPMKLNNQKTSKTNAIHRPLEDAVQKLIDVYAERVERLTEKLRSKEVEQQIILRTLEDADLSRVEREYIEWRYFVKLPAWRVAQKIGYSEKQARRIKLGALQKLFI